MALDEGLFERTVKGLNSLEGKQRSFKLSGLSIVEADDLEQYLSNYNVKRTHSIKLDKRYMLRVSKKGAYT